MASTGSDVTGVARAEQVVADAVAAFDPALVSAARAAEAVEAFGRIERMAAAARGRAAARVARTTVWREQGHRSPAHWMAGRSGGDVGEAARLLDAVEAATGATEEAFTTGQLSPRQARAIGTAAAADPSSEARLLEQAPKLSVRELEDEARRVERAASGEAAEERHRRVHRRRHVRTWTDGDGAGRGSWSIRADHQATVLAALDRLRSAEFRRARREGRREPGEAYLADALVALAEQFLGADRPAESPVASSPSSGPAIDGATDPARPPGSPARGTGAAGGDRAGVAERPTRTTRSGADVKVIVRVDGAALERGWVAEGEVCEVAGIGPVPVDAVREWVAGDAFKAAVVADGVDVRNVAHLGRRPVALQHTALQWAAARTCSVTGCTSTARLEIDHVADWATTRRTVLAELAPLCGHHHDLKTHHGYALGSLGPDGRRTLHPPGTGRGADDRVVDPPPRMGRAVPRPGRSTPEAERRRQPGRRRPPPTDGQTSLLDTG